MSEGNLAKAKVGQPVEILLDALPDVRFRGKVAGIVPTVDRAKATVMTKIQFDQLDARVIHVEGGPRLNASLLDAGLVDAKEAAGRLAVARETIDRAWRDYMATELTDEEARLAREAQDSSERIAGQCRWASR